MPRRAIANQNRRESEFLTVRQIADGLACDPGMVYQLIAKGEILGIRPFHDSGIIRVPVESYRAYVERRKEAAEQKLAGNSPAQEPAPRRTPRVRADHAAHRAAVERMRARGIVC